LVTVLRACWWPCWWLLLWLSQWWLRRWHRVSDWVERFINKWLWTIDHCLQLCSQVTHCDD
jgi:hypothetical protein